MLKEECTMFPIKGKTVLVSGASSGIGKACAYAFAKAGAGIFFACFYYIL